jgi:hypothetical protein
MDSIGAIRGSSPTSLPPAASAPVSEPAPAPSRKQDTVDVSTASRVKYENEQAERLAPKAQAPSPLDSLGV